MIPLRILDDTLADCFGLWHTCFELVVRQFALLHDVVNCAVILHEVDQRVNVTAILGVTAHLEFFLRVADLHQSGLDQILTCCFLFVERDVIVDAKIACEA